MVVFILKEMIRKQQEKDGAKAHPKASKKEQIMTEFYNGTKLTLKGLARKYKTSYQYVRGVRSEFLRETA